MLLSKFRALRKPAVAASVLALAGVAMAATPASANQNGTLAAYQLFNFGSNLCADLPGYGPGVPDGPVNMWDCRPYGDNQLWTYARTRIATPNIYQIRNSSDGMCLDLPDYGSVPAGTPVTEYPCATRPIEDNQEWFFFESETSGRITIQNVQSRLCLSGLGAPGDRVRVAECVDGDAYQRWLFS